MENLLALMNIIINSWMSPRSMDIAMDMIIAFMCGAGLFFLLLPFLKECPVSPPPESEWDIPKDVQRGQRNTRKKAATVKDCRDGRKNMEETTTPSQPMKICTKQLLQDSMLQPLWNPLQKMDHLPLFHRLSYVKFLENLIQKEFSQLFWGISSMFSESVVATAHILRTLSFAKHKTVRFRDACGPAQALSQAQGTPQLSQDLPWPPEQVTSFLESVTGVQEMEMVTSSTPNEMPPCFKRRACGIPCPTTKRETQTFLPTENQPWQHGLYWKGTKGSDIQNPQAAIFKSTRNFSKDTLHKTAIWSGSILPEHCHMIHDNEEPQTEDEATIMEEQEETSFRFRQYRKWMQLQGHHPANCDNYCKRKTQQFQPAQPPILNSKSNKCSKMMESVPLGVPLKKDIATCDIHNTIKKGLGLGDKDVPCTSCSSPGKGLKLRNPELSSDNLFNMNSAEIPSFLDSKTERKLEPNITQLPVKHRRSYMHTVESGDLTPPGVPASKLPQVVFPSSPICDSKAEYYSKAAMIMENLHHQDPGGKRVESISDAKLDSALLLQSTADIQETQRAPLPAAIHGASNTQPYPLQVYVSVQQPAFCFEAKPSSSRTIQCTGKDSLEPNTSHKMPKLLSWKRFQDVESGQPCCHLMVIDPEQGVLPSAATQSSIVEVKESPSSWTVSLGSSEIHNILTIRISPGDVGSLEANKIPGHLQTPTPQHSQDSGLKPQAYSKIDLISKEQPEGWLVSYDSDSSSTVHPAKVNLPSEHSLISLQNTCQNPQTLQGLGDVCRRSSETVETEENRVPKDKIKVKDLKEVHSHEERQSIMRSTDINEGESLERVWPSIPSSTHLNDTAKTWIPGKGEATSQSSWNALQYENFSTKYTGPGDSLQNDHPPSAAEQIQEAITRNKVIYNLIAEIQYLLNILLQILENTEGYPSKVQGCKLESLTSQLGGSAHSSEGLHYTNHSRATSRRSCGHASPELHNYPFTYRGIGDKLLSGIEDQRACDHHLNQVKRGMGFDQLPMPKDYDLPCMYRGIGDKQEPGLADQRACDPCTTNIVMGPRPHRRHKGHKHSFGYREVVDEQQSGVHHKVCDPHQSRKKEMGSGCFLSPRENHPVKNTGTDHSWPSAAAQQASDPRLTQT